MPKDWWLHLTHWGQVTHICVSKLAIISSDNGLLPGQRETIIWTNAGILLIGPLGTNFIDIWIEIQIFSFRKMHLKMASAKWHPFCLGLNALKERLTWEQLHYLWLNVLAVVNRTITGAARTHLQWHSHQNQNHAGGKWLIHDTKRRKDNQLQSLKLPCRISKLSS